MTTSKQARNLGRIVSSFRFILSSTPRSLVYTSSRFYRQVVEKIKKRVELEFGLTKLWFTAPTFITRLIGGGEPKHIHDEYW